MKYSVLFKKQQGAATLILVAMLTMMMAVLTLVTARTGIMEQKITANDLRAREVKEAAEAGLEYGVAWVKVNALTNPVTCVMGSLPAGCPTALTTITGSSTGESYSYSLAFTLDTNYIRIISTAQGVSDNTITATAESYVQQNSVGLFNDNMAMPPPWVVAGCVTSPATGTPDTYVLTIGGNALINGSDCSAYDQQGHLDVATWVDSDGDGVMDSGEGGGSTTFNQGTFAGCPSSNCAWNYAFNLSLAEAKTMATNAGHVYNSNIPCGAASASPSIYLVNNSGPINSGDISGSCSGNGVDGTTIGTPDAPIIIIFPSSAGCPKLNGGVRIYGIVYYESTTSCASNGWGGAEVYGSVMWEGNVEKPNANSKFIEVDYENDGDLDDVFNINQTVTSSSRVPGTWKDF